MEKYYFDTSVWLAYLIGDEPYSPEARRWFERITGSDASLASSRLVSSEIRKKRPEIYSKYSALCETLLAQNKLEFIGIFEEDRRKAYEYRGRTGFGYGDILHLVLAKRYGAHAVSADIHHWPKIARLLELYDFNFITDISPWPLLS